MLRDASAIKYFVKEKLGCGCPDSLFDRIDYQENASVVDCGLPIQRILIGDRLLIYLLEFGEGQFPPEFLPLLIESAKSERDGNRYNRARLVIVCDQAEAIRAETERLFEAIEGVDAKLHLHLLSRAEFGEFL